MFFQNCFGEELMFLSFSLQIQKYFQLMRAIDDELKFNIMARPNRTEENDNGD